MLERRLNIYKPSIKSMPTIKIHNQIDQPEKAVITRIRPTWQYNHVLFRYRLADINLSFGISHYVKEKQSIPVVFVHPERIPKMLTQSEEHH